MVEAGFTVSYFIILNGLLIYQTILLRRIAKNTAIRKFI